jgi:SPFH domain / Band 7 family
MLLRAASSLQRISSLRQAVPVVTAAASRSTGANYLILSRAKSSYSFDGVGGGGADMWEWPITKTNTVFNIVPQGHKYIVERFGKLHEVHESGWFLAIPLVDNVAYVIDVRERALDIAPQAAITRDNGT